MAYHDEGYYGASAPPRQPLEMRSSSVSSSSSSASCSVPYSTVPSAHVGIARTVSPTANTSDPGTGPVVYSRHPYPTLAHEQPFTFRAHPLPSQLLQAQNPSPLSLYPSSSFQPPRQVSRPSPYGGYSVDNLHHQPPSFSYETWNPMFASSTPCHPPPSSIPYQSRPRSNDENWFLNGMRRLPPEVVHRIQKYVTWYHCWKATKICKWFLYNFHPDNFHHELKVAQILNTERNRGSAPSDEDFTDVAEPKKPGKEFEFFACYHCFRFKGFDRFEAQKHTTSVFRGEDDFEEDSGTTSSSTATTKREKSFTPSSSRSPSANPHYDPTLTRSSLRASSSSTTGRGCRATATATSSATSPAASGDPLAHMHPRTKRTYGQRRFCVDCGLKAGFYEPGDLIELQKPRKKGDAMWVCRCKKLHSRMDGAQCYDCNSIAPLSVPR